MAGSGDLLVPDVRRVGVNDEPRLFVQLPAQCQRQFTGLDAAADGSPYDRCARRYSWMQEASKRLSSGAVPGLGAQNYDHQGRRHWDYRDQASSGLSGLPHCAPAARGSCPGRDLCLASATRRHAAPSHAPPTTARASQAERIRPQPRSRLGPPALHSATPDITRRREPRTRLGPPALCHPWWLRQMRRACRGVRAAPAHAALRPSPRRSCR
jgi:hypothetical protein